MDAIDLSQDEGFIDVIVAEGQTLSIDVFDAQNRIADYWKANHQKSAAEYNTGLVDLLRELGLPAGSHFLAARFAATINQRAEELKKKLATSLGSPTSTTSIPGN